MEEINLKDQIETALKEHDAIIDECTARLKENEFVLNELMKLHQDVLAGRIKSIEEYIKRKEAIKCTNNEQS